MPALLDLFLTFAYLGLISVGGAMTVIPEMERQVVVVHGWMNHQAFVEAYALGQFAPGPNMLHVFLVGYRVAALPGALAAGLGMFGPTSLLLAGVARVAAAPRPPAWVTKFQGAMGPVTIGLMGAAAWTLGRDSVRSPLLAGICALSAVAVIRKWLDPAWVVVLAAAVGAVAAWGGVA
ncbi:MAG: chromate transport protein ChrA [Cyanobacteria bacterium RYN_339]|nr:chromate transport protein ChrA [Cyanobacteria bacterium RYN_339]